MQGSQGQEDSRSNDARSAATRAALLAAARDLFVEKGYAATGTPELVARASVTRGALYHHFADKQALFRALVEIEAEAVAAEVEHASRDADPVQALAAGSRAFVTAMARPGRTRLLLVEAPAVLGRAEVDAIDARHAGRTLREGLQAGMSAGALRPLPLGPTALLLAGAFDRAALAIEAGGNALEWGAALDALLAGLGNPPGAARTRSPSRR